MLMAGQRGARHVLQPALLTAKLMYLHWKYTKVAGCCMQNAGCCMQNTGCFNQAKHGI